MKIFLDDDPVRDSWVDDTWVILRDPRALIGMLMVHDGEIEVLSLDHDLGWFEDRVIHGEVKNVEVTGYTVLTDIEANMAAGLIKNPPRFEIHSANPVGRKNMQAAIDSIERMRRS